jgi:two-component system, NarL family, nitrate/nitrite response regulator NarL
LSASARVVIADDHAVTRLGLRIALEDGGFSVVAEAGTAEDAVQAVCSLQPDACLIDLHIPGGGLAAAATIRAQCPQTAILMLTTFADPSEFLGAIRAGASGYLPKTMSAQRLPAALKGALSGEAAVPRALVGCLLDDIREREAGGLVRSLADGRRVALTRREGQVLDFLLDELPTGEIAARLGISRVTVRRYVSEVLHKLDAPDRKAAVALLNRRG